MHVGNLVVFLSLLSSSPPQSQPEPCIACFKSMCIAGSLVEAEYKKQKKLPKEERDPFVKFFWSVRSKIAHPGRKFTRIECVLLVLLLLGNLPSNRERVRLKTCFPPCSFVCVRVFGCSFVCLFVCFYFCSLVCCLFACLFVVCLLVCACVIFLSVSVYVSVRVQGTETRYS